MAQQWQMARIKREQAQLLDSILPGQKRWKQLQQLYEWSTFSISQGMKEAFGKTSKEKETNTKTYGLKSNKRGQVANIMIIGVMVFVFALILLLFYFIYSQIDTGFQASALSAQPQATNSLHSIINKYPALFDNSMLIILFGMFFATLLTSALILIHPALSILYGLLLIIITIIMAVMSDVYQEVAANASLATAAANLPISGVIMGYFPIIIFFFGIACGAIMFKLRSVMQA